MHACTERWMPNLRCCVFSGAELTAFLCLLKGILGPTTAHFDNEGLIDGLWRDEMRCISPNATGADLWGLDLGRIAKSTSFRLEGCARHSAPLQDGVATNVALCEFSSRRAMRRQTWRRRGTMMDGSCRKCSGSARWRSGPKLMNRCSPEEVDTKEHGKMVKRILTVEKGRVPDTNARGLRVGGEKKSHKKRVQKAVGGVRSWRFRDTKRVVEHRQKQNVGRQRSLARRRWRLCQMTQSHAQSHSLDQLAEG